MGDRLLIQVKLIPYKQHYCIFENKGKGAIKILFEGENNSISWTQLCVLFYIVYVTNYN